MTVSAFAITSFVIIAVTLLLLQIGIIFGRKKSYLTHSRVMGSALVLNTIFLIMYVIRFVTGTETRFPGPDFVKFYFYYPFLLTHIVLSIVVIVWLLSYIPRSLKERKLSPDGTLYFQTKEFREIHRKRGRVAYILWTISFAMGITIFFMLYVIQW